MPKLSVIIVNWNGVRWIARCLDSLRAQTFSDFEVIVVDNGSMDNSTEIIEKNYPEVELVCKNKNLGFAKANNIAASMAKGEWLVLLNNDAFPEPDWLFELITAAEENTMYSGFSSCQLSDHPGENGDLIDGIGDVYHCSGKPWRIGYKKLLSDEYTYPREVFGPCGASAMYKKELFLEYGGFDEDFFCYMEDIDLAFRFQLYGNKFLYVPTARVRHIGSATTGVASDFSRYYGHRNMVWTYLKNMPILLLLVTLPLHMILTFVSLIMLSFQGQGKVVFNAKIDALRQYKKIIIKRKAIQARKTVSNSELLNVVECRLVILIRHFLDR